MLPKLEGRFGLPPLTAITSLLSGENGKRLDGILTKLEKLSRNKDSMTEAVKLLQTVQELGKSGDLERLASILNNLPKGKSGQAMLSEVNRLLEKLGSRVDKMAALAETILAK